MQQRKGDRSERELVNVLDEAGLAVMRAPASGSATDRELPDVLAGLDGAFSAIEAKSSSTGVVYIDQSEVEDLKYFAQCFGAVARIGVRFNHTNGDPPYGNDNDTGWRFFKPEDLYRTDGNNYRVKKQTAYERGDRIDDLIR